MYLRITGNWKLQLQGCNYTPSLGKWVEWQAEDMSEGQRPFERASQLRAAEKSSGTTFTYSELT